MTALAAPVEEHEAAPRVERVEDLPDPVRREIVAARQSGLTLHELKSKFAHVAPDVIRECLPPGNAREAKARTTRAKPRTAAQAAKSSKPVGGKPAAKKQEPAPKATEDKQPRYVDDAELAEAVLKARKLLGRARLAEVVGASQSSIWRAENNRSYSTEVDDLREALRKVDAGEVEVPTRGPRAKALGKADLVHRLEVVAELLRTGRSDKGITKAALVDSALAVLDPTDAPKA
jgi:hypothetical protein